MPSLDELAFIVVIGAFAVVGLREFRKIFVETRRLAAGANKKLQAEQKWSHMFDSLPMAIEQTEAMLFEMKAKQPPPTPDQLEPIERRLKQLHTVEANQWWIEIALKVLGPAADRVVRSFI